MTMLEEVHGRRPGAAARETVVTEGRYVRPARRRARPPAGHGRRRVVARRRRAEGAGAERPRGRRHGARLALRAGLSCATARERHRRGPRRGGRARSAPAHGLRHRRRRPGDGPPRGRRRSRRAASRSASMDAPLEHLALLPGTERGRCGRWRRPARCAVLVSPARRSARRGAPRPRAAAQRSATAGELGAERVAGPQRSGELGHVVRPDAGHRGLGRDPAGDLVDLVEGDRVEGGDRRVRVDLLAVHDGLRGRVAGHRVRVLEGEHPAAGGVGARPLDLLLRRAVRRAARRRSRASGGRPRRTCPTRGPRRAAGSARRRRRGRRSRRSRRGRAARGSRRTAASPSSRRAACRRRSARRGPCWLRGVDRRPVGDAQVRLVGVALLHERLRRERRRLLVAAVGLDRREAAERSRRAPGSPARARGCRRGTRRRASPPTGAGGRRRSRRG